MQNYDRIPREVPVRQIAASEIEQITKAVFVPPQPRPSELLLVFGASATSGRWEHAARLMRDGYAPRAVVTGGVPYQDGSDALEAEGIRNALAAAGAPPSAILVETRSTNTLENIRFSADMLDAVGARPRSLLFYCKSHHSARVWRTLSKHLPDAFLSCATYDASYGGVTVSAADLATKRGVSPAGPR